MIPEGTEGRDPLGRAAPAVGETESPPSGNGSARSGPAVAATESQSSSPRLAPSGGGTAIVPSCAPSGGGTARVPSAPTGSAPAGGGTSIVPSTGGGAGCLAAGVAPGFLTVTSRSSPSLFFFTPASEHYPRFNGRGLYRPKVLLSKLSLALWCNSQA